VLGKIPLLHNCQRSLPIGLRPIRNNCLRVSPAEAIVYIKRHCCRTILIKEHTHHFYFGKNGGDNRDRTGNLLRAKQALSQLSYIPINSICSRPRQPSANVVGPPGFEPGTSALSARRSSHLSYRPRTTDYTELYAKGRAYRNTEWLKTTSFAGFSASVAAITRNHMLYLISKPQMTQNSSI
jgi:hypothetical protein